MAIFERVKGCILETLSGNSDKEAQFESQTAPQGISASTNLCLQGKWWQDLNKNFDWILKCSDKFLGTSIALKLSIFCQEYSYKSSHRTILEYLTLQAAYFTII